MYEKAYINKVGSNGHELNGQELTLSGSEWQTSYSEHIANGGLGSGTTQLQSVVHVPQYLHYRDTSSSSGLKIRGKTGLACKTRWITKVGDL